MTQLIVMAVSLIVFGLLLCLLKVLLWWLGRQESKKRRTRIVLSRKFQIQRPISIQIKSQYDSHEGRARILNRTESVSSAIYGATEKRPRIADSTENMDVICSICLGVYQEGQQLFVLNCGHVYHEDCILTWLDEDNICPICRRIMSGSDLDFVVQTIPTSASYYKKISYI